MKIDALKQFSRLRDTLLHERTELQTRLAKINDLLGSTVITNHRAPNTSRISRKARKGRRRSGLSLREAILKVTAAKALTRDEILNAVKKLGYKFSTSKPIGSINSCLYQSGAFVRKNGRFAPK